MANKIYSLLNAMLDRKEATIEVEPTASVTDNTESQIARYITLYQEGKISAKKCLANIAWYMTYKEDARYIKNMVLLKTLEVYLANAKWGEDYDHNLDDFHIKSPNDGLKEIANMLRNLASDIERFNKFREEWDLNTSQCEEHMAGFNKHLSFSLLNSAEHYQCEADNLEEILAKRTLTPKEAVNVTESYFDVLCLNPRTYEIVMYFILLATDCDDDSFSIMADELRNQLA